MLTEVTTRYVALAWKDPQNIVDELNERKSS